MAPSKVFPSLCSDGKHTGSSNESILQDLQVLVEEPGLNQVTSMLLQEVQLEVALVFHFCKQMKNEFL